MRVTGELETRIFNKSTFNRRRFVISRLCESRTESCGDGGFFQKENKDRNGQYSESVLDLANFIVNSYTSDSE